MAIPNTTPTPNELYNGEMKKMSDTELRVVLVVTRATLGWEMDHETGRRKQEDWISYYQLKEKTGRGYTALASAIASCIKNGWIEVRDSKGNILYRKNDRIGKKLFYRLGKIFLDKIRTSTESGEDKITSSESVITENKITESEAYKRNTIQNKNFTKDFFEEFWILYPRKVSRKKAFESFNKINPDNELQKKILSALEIQKQSEQWQKNDGKFIPHPTTWLNQERWEDEMLKGQEEELIVPNYAKNWSKQHGK